MVGRADGRGGEHHRSVRLRYCRHHVFSARSALGSGARSGELHMGNAGSASVVSMPWSSLRVRSNKPHSSSSSPRVNAFRVTLPCSARSLTSACFRTHRALLWMAVPCPWLMSGRSACQSVALALSGGCPHAPEHRRGSQNRRLRSCESDLRKPACTVARSGRRPLRLAQHRRHLHCPHHRPPHCRTLNSMRGVTGAMPHGRVCLFRF